MKYLLHVILLAVLLFTVSLCAKINAEEVIVVDPCLIKCLKPYRICRAKVLTESKEDEDVARECEEVYYSCFYKHSCMREGAR